MLHSGDGTASISSSERSTVLDVLRGMAIFGILLNNIQAFSGYAFLSEEAKSALPTDSTDRFFEALQYLFVEGKFYSIFSLLFGVGFAIILTRMSQKGINPLKIFYRRLSVLIAIGLIHACLLWDGDILLLYGLIGLFLPMFRNFSDSRLLVLAACLIVSPVLIDAVRVLMQASPGDWFLGKAQALDKVNGVPLDSSLGFYLFTDESGWREWRNWLESGIYYRYEYILNSNRVVKVLGMFLIGFYAGRKGIHQHLEEYRPLFVKMRNYGFLLGLTASIGRVYFELDDKHVHSSAWGIMDTLFYALTVVPLALAYVAVVCLWWSGGKHKSLLSYLAPAGRMALTNYLLQTLVCIFIFYGVGLRLGARFGPTLLYPIALFIFAAQVVLSNYWFLYFNYGPLEWIWRQLTYLQRVPIMKRYAQDS